MDRLRQAMQAGADLHPPGSLEAIAAIGQAYVDFARREPGVFRLVFGLTEGHEEDAELLDKGQSCFGVVLEATARRLGLSPEDPDAQRRAYLLWSFVHGHSFLTIDRKNVETHSRDGDWDYLMQVARGIVG